MAKLKQVYETDFDFSKIPQKAPSYFWERLTVTFFVVAFSSLLFLAPSMKPGDTSVIQYEPYYAYPEDVSSVSQDYTVTSEDKALFEEIFNYNSKSSFSKNSEIKTFQKMVRDDDLLNNPFTNKKDFNVTSKIISIEPSDKTAIVGENGRADLDYVDLVVQKTYTQNAKSHQEQNMVSLVLDKHKIISINSQRMVD